KIGTTPLQIDKNKYLNEEIKIILGTKSKSIIVEELMNNIYVDFDTNNVLKPIIENEIPVAAPVITTPQESNGTNCFIWFSLIVVVLIAVGFVVSETNKNNFNSNFTEEEIVESPVEPVDTFAV